MFHDFVKIFEKLLEGGGFVFAGLNFDKKNCGFEFGGGGRGRRSDRGGRSAGGIVASIRGLSHWMRKLFQREGRNAGRGSSLRFAPGVRYAQVFLAFFRALWAGEYYTEKDLGIKMHKKSKMALALNSGK
ncbi:MAG: hypothetical protein WCW30_04545 [Candidatus Gracilibacteria bacterium]